MDMVKPVSGKHVFKEVLKSVLFADTNLLVFEAVTFAKKKSFFTLPVNQMQTSKVQVVQFSRIFLLSC